MDGAKRGQKKTGTIAERDLKLISTAYFEMFSINKIKFSACHTGHVTIPDYFYL